MVNDLDNFRKGQEVQINLKRLYMDYLRTGDVYANCAHLESGLNLLHFDGNYFLHRPGEGICAEDGDFLEVTFIPCSCESVEFVKPHASEPISFTLTINDIKYSIF